MSVIYEPRGKAREYSPLACNIYIGCNHGCKYCYAPNIRYQKREEYLTVKPRRNIVQEFERDCKKNTGTDKQVLFCFMSDPYNSLESELRLTRECLKLALKYDIPVAVLTKSKTVFNDIDIIKQFGNKIQVGMTLTMNSADKSKEWEPEAATPDERIETLSALKKEGVRTWASFEPVIFPEESLAIMERSIPYVDIYKVGKLNNFQGLDKIVDWAEFLRNSTEILRKNGKPFYVKKDLREAAQSIKLYGNEVYMDEFNVA